MTKNDDTAVLLERLARVLQNDHALEGLNSVQWEALRYFARANRFSRTPSGLTAYLGVTKGTVSQTINAIERKGLVEKKSIKGDGRSVNVNLTRKGRKVLANDPLTNLTDDLFGFSQNELELMHSLLGKLVVNALHRRHSVPFGVCRTCRYFQQEHEQGKPHRCGLLEVPLAEGDASLICREYKISA